MSGPLQILQRYVAEKAEKKTQNSGGATPPATNATPADEPASEPTTTDQAAKKDNSNG